MSMNGPKFDAGNPSAIQRQRARPTTAIGRMLLSRRCVLQCPTSLVCWYAVRCCQEEEDETESGGERTHLVMLQVQAQPSGSAPSQIRKGTRQDV